jgi:uncharacterized protein YjiS (DUF1127 family)
MAYAQTASAGQFNIIARISEFAQNLRARNAQYRVYRDTLGELSDMTARDLADIGLNRSMIKSVAYEAAYKN